MLYKLKIIKRNTKTGDIFENIYSNVLNEHYDKPSSFVIKNWSKLQEYKKSNKVDRSTSGSVFESLICTLLFRENIFPLFTQVQVAFVPSAKFDILLYNNKKNVVSLSLKTTLRERWKQADLEAFALKNVHRNSRSYLITLSEKEANSTKNKIETGGVLGLNDVVLANSNQFDELIKNLKDYEYVNPGTINILEKFTEINNQ